MGCQVHRRELLDEQKQAVKANLAVMNCIDGQVVELERCILAKVKLREDFKGLKTVSGIGQILALTIALETGDIARFAARPPPRDSARPGPESTRRSPQTPSRPPCLARSCTRAQ